MAWWKGTSLPQRHAGFSVSTTRGSGPEAIADRLADINSAMTRADGTTRRMRFEQEEAPVMRDLPPTPFTEVYYKRLKVDRNWHITCDYQYYSVPFQLVGEAVTVRLTPQLVSIFNGDQLVAEHTRLHGF